MVSGSAGVDSGTTVTRRLVLVGLAMAGAVTAVIHFAVAGEHFQEYWLFGLFMLVVAWLQLLWSIGAVVRPTRLLLWSGAVLNVGVVAIYIVTRTVGDVIGPTPHDVEPFGLGDGLCTVLEAVVAVGCLALLARAWDQPVRRRQLSATAVVGATLAAVLLSVALVDGGSEMVMGPDDAPTTPAGHPMAMAGSSGSTASTIRLTTTSPAGAITMPDPMAEMGPGMAMASSKSCTATPTTRQQQAAVQLVDTSWKDVSPYRSLAAAKAVGYRPVTPTGRPVVHYINPAYYRATVAGGPILDPTAPQALVYANTPKGAVLAATMYMGAPSATEMPQPGGCLTQWHIHTNLCLDASGVVGIAHPTCPAGSTNRPTGPMMHVWYVPIPGGPTAVDATNLQVVQAAEQVSAPVNGTA